MNLGGINIFKIKNMIYKELELEPGYHTWGDYVRLNNLKKFLPDNVINSLKNISEVTDDTTFWSDGKKMVKATTLNEAFPLIIEQGYRYINTYWVGGSSGQAHKVLTFIK